MEPVPLELPADLGQEVTAGFHERYAAQPAVVARAPGRVNLVGEHTDYNAGLCLPIALPHATWVAVAPRDDGRVRISSAAMPDAWSGTLGGPAPGAVPGWPAYVAGVLATLRDADRLGSGLDVHVASTVPIGAGLSSSAALTCATALAALTVEEPPGRVTDGLRSTVAEVATAAETEQVGAPTGGLDQAAAVWCSPGHALLLDFADHGRAPVPWRPGEDGLLVLVVDTGVVHTHSGGGYGRRRAECDEAARMLGVPTLRGAGSDRLERLPPRLRARARHVLGENARVRTVVDAAGVRDWERVGTALTASHASLRDDFEVSVPELDLVVDTALAHGALGARMTGGGFGGSAVVLVARERVEGVRQAVLREFTGHGYAAPRFLPAPASAGASVESTAATSAPPRTGRAPGGPR